jgi:Uma2 family endonuclease
MLAETEKRYYTPEEYLALDEAAEYKSEYLDGEILPMTGGTANHNKIALNFCRIFPLTVSGQNYEIFINDLRLWIPRYRLYTYPDVMVIQGEPVYQGNNTTTVTNPLLIVEVLSKSTKDYDRGEKFLYYRSIPELREYILIDQYKYHVEQLTKTADDKWLFTEYESEDSVLAMDSVEFQISLTDIYDRINFEVAAA